MPVPPATFRPAYWRCYPLVALAWVGTGVLVAVLNPRSGLPPGVSTMWREVLSSTVIFGLLGSVLLTLLTQHRLTITVTAAGVSGPGTWGWHQPCFPLTHIDCARSATQSRWQRIGGLSLPLVHRRTKNYYQT